VGFKLSQNIGHIYENLVFLELKRRNKDLFYWKSKDGKEVDFVIREGTKIEQAIQVCYDVHKLKTKEREIAGLLAMGDELNLRKFLIITADEEKEEKINKLKIKFIPLWKWLLKEESNLS
jgi:predicted AAA+ superfamily ATPase